MGKKIWNKVSETPLRHLIVFCKDMLSYQYVQIIIEVIFAFWIAIEINAYSDKKVELISLIIVGIIYIFTLIIIQYINKINEKVKIDLVESRQLTKNVVNNYLLKDCKKMMVDRAEILQEQSESGIIDILSDTKLQDSLKEISRKIYAFISERYSCEDVDVIMFQQFLNEKEKTSYVTPIAYGNKNNITPNCYGVQYNLEGDNTYLISKIFNKGKSDYVCFLNQKEVKKKLTYMDDYSRDNEKIRQYFAIPTRTMHGVITIVIQIIFYKEVLKKKEVDQFINEYIRPYMCISELFIDEQRLIEAILQNQGVE